MWEGLKCLVFVGGYSLLKLVESCSSHRHLEELRVLMAGMEFQGHVMELGCDMVGCHSWKVVMMVLGGGFYERGVCESHHVMVDWKEYCVDLQGGFLHVGLESSRSSGLQQWRT